MDAFLSWAEYVNIKFDIILFAFGYRSIEVIFMSFNKQFSTRVLSVLLLVCLLSLTACTEKENIKIGYIGNMTELAADLGVDGRNGVILYIEQVNANGGVDGRLVELVSKDDKGKPEEAPALHQAFKDEGVSLVLGHLMSSMASSMMQSQGEDLLFLTPSMSTNELAEKNDYIIRSTPTLQGQAITIIEDMLARSIESTYIIFDSRNAAYSEALMEYTLEVAQDRGVNVIGVMSISDEPYEYKQIADAIVNENPESIFMITSSIDTAFIAQRVKQVETQAIDLYSVSWSMTRDMIDNGGRAVEDMRLVGVYIPEVLTDDYYTFKSDFEKRFGYEPTFIAELTYDATKLMLQAVENAGSEDVDKVKEALINIEFNGLKENFTLDENGDSNRKYLIHVVNEEEFVPEWK